MPILQKGSWRRDRKRGNHQIVPTLMLGQDSAQIYVQNGQFFGAGGTHMPSPPEWAVESLSRMSKDAQESLGFEMKFGKLKPRGAAKAAPEPKPTPVVEPADNEDGDAEDDDE